MRITAHRITTVLVAALAAGAASATDLGATLTWRAPLAPSEPGSPATGWWNRPTVQTSERPNAGTGTIIQRTPPSEPGAPATGPACAALTPAAPGSAGAARHSPQTPPTMDQPAREASASDQPYQIRKATQEVVRQIVHDMRPFIVRIETVGGAQPKGSVGTVEAPPEDTDPTEGKKKRKQKAFEDTPGADFVVADGPTTGLIYSADGYIITSSFNFIREPALTSVLLADGRRLAADLVARDKVRKIALLKVDAADLPVPEWAPTADIQVGQWAVALGLGFGGTDASVTVGVISALNRMLGNAIQTDAKLSPANYGGPLCDLHGRVLGICVPMAQRPGELAGIEMYDAGVGFAVPKHRVDEIVTELKTGRSFYRGWLGVQTDPRSKDGLVIKNVADPSPMHAAGVRPGDRLIAAENKPIKHFGHLVQTLYMLPAGQEVYVLLERHDREFGVVITLARSADLGELPDDVEEPFDPSNPFPTLPKPKERDHDPFKLP